MGVFDAISEMMVRPVAGQDDLFAFQFDFIPEGKALDEGGTAPVVTEADNGDLIIEGWAAVFNGQDRQNENFMDGAFTSGIKSFLGGQSALCFHHKHDKCLGKVLELSEHEGKGLKMKARVDGAIRTHPELGTYYEQIKRGTLNALSVGGFFKRKLTEAGYKIAGVDFTEISVTPVPVHPGTSFAVVAGKALQSEPDAGTVVVVRPEDKQINQLLGDLDAMFTRIEALPGKHTETVA